jgi:DNA-directed RNA polymerase subunit RPC12/RpoP
MNEGIAISMPLDSDGFLRRRCPQCSREFKWHHDESDETGATPPEGGYHCPYCDEQTIDSWFTVAQQAAIDDEVRFLAESQLHDAVKATERHSNEFIKIEAGPAPTRRNRPPLTESDDMRRVDFACHAAEPVKVLEDWSETVHCLVCGQPAD